MANEFFAARGDIVDDVCHLGSMIARGTCGGNADCAVFETEFGPEALPAVIWICDRSLSNSSGLNSEDLMERWRAAPGLAHPNLLKAYATGSSVVYTVPVVYLVTERPTDSLESVLKGRVLRTDEMEEVLWPVLSALKYLHNAGYAHLQLTAGNILAVGEQLKLSIDSAAPARDERALAEDMRALGVLIVRALTQKLPDPAVVKGIPHRFAEVVRGCLDPDPDTRWSAEQAEAALASRDAVSPESDIPRAEPVPEPRPVQAEANPWASTRPGLPEPAPHRPETTQNPGLPKWVYAGVAGMVLIVILLALGRHRSPEPTVAAAAIPAPRHEPATVSPFSRPEVKPQAVAEMKRDAPHAGERKKNGWSVIVATYNSREAAEKRMHSLAARWPAFHVSIFNPQSEKAHYLVTLGQNLGEDEAEVVRRRAVAAGLPRDTYIKRLM
jgi:hypothetical protein